MLPHQIEKFVPGGGGRIVEIDRVAWANRSRLNDIISVDE